jgi:beta-1,4-mannosyltransferase
MNPHPLRALFAPDWREGVPYQQLLANALARHGVTVSYLSGYKRLLPLSRLRRASSEHDVLHMHWPEAYYPAKGDGLDLMRSMRFALDLALTVRQGPMVVTAHNLHAHNRGDEWLAHRNYRVAFRRADAVFAHSAAARLLLINQFRLNEARVHVVPHGDLSATMPSLHTRADARRRLALGDEPTCLMFGAIEPYKGVEEVIAFWRDRKPPVRLAIAGRAFTEEYAAAIRDAAAGIENVQLVSGRLTEEELSDWLAAADCVLFNYQVILTSGAASLTRSLGVPLLIPKRCATVDLSEPDDRVIRFESLGDGFVEKMKQAISRKINYAAAQHWRTATSWLHVADLTAAVYRKTLDERNVRRGRLRAVCTPGRKT